jgi:hypothetical protein
VPYTRAQQAFVDFKERFSEEPGVRLVESGDLEGKPCIVAMVDEGFNVADLPAAFQGFPVLVNDGTNVHYARGDLI